jgi:hypothetical protein
VETVRIVVERAEVAQDYYSLYHQSKVELEASAKHVELLMLQLKELENQLVLSQMKQPPFSSESQSQKQKPRGSLGIDEILSDFCASINDKCTTMKSTKRIINSLIKAMHQPSFVDGAVAEAFLRKAKEVFRESIFCPFKILREMDARGGVLSYEGLEVLRVVETQGKKRFRQGLIPCSATMKRAASVVEFWAKDKLPYTVSSIDCGEMVVFNADKVLELAVKALGLAEAAKTRSVRFSRCADGAALTKNMGHVIYGIKGNDKGARDPVSSICNIDSRDEQVLQSRNFVFPLVMVMGKETKKMVQESSNRFLMTLFKLGQ